jgi:hypothetical protein
MFLTISGVETSLGNTTLKGRKGQTRDRAAMSLIGMMIIVVVVI